MNGHTQSGIYDLAQTPSGEIIIPIQRTFKLQGLSNKIGKGPLVLPLKNHQNQKSLEQETTLYLLVHHSSAQL